MPAGYFSIKDFLQMAIKLYHCGRAMEGGVLLHQGLMGEDGMPKQLIFSDAPLLFQEMQAVKKSQKQAVTPLDLVQVAMQTSRGSEADWEVLPDGNLVKQVEFLGPVTVQADQTIQSVYVVTIVAKQDTTPSVGGTLYQYEVEYEEQVRELIEQDAGYRIQSTEAVYKSPTLQLDRCYDKQGNFDHTLIPTRADVVSHKEKVDIEPLAKSRVALPRSFMTFATHVLDLILAKIPDKADFLELRKIVEERDAIQYFKFFNELSDTLETLEGEDRVVFEKKLKVLQNFLRQAPDRAMLQQFSTFQAIGTGWGKSFIEMLAGTALGGIICVVPDDTLRLQLVDDYKQIIRDEYPRSLNTEVNPPPINADAEDPIFTLREKKKALERKYADYESQLVDMQVQGDQRDLAKLKSLLATVLTEIDRLLLVRENQTKEMPRLLKNQSLGIQTVIEVLKQDEFWRKHRSVNPELQLVIKKECGSFLKILKSLKELEDMSLTMQSQIASDTTGFSIDELRRIITKSTKDAQDDLKAHLEKQPFLLLTLEELQLLEPVLERQFIMIDEIHQMGSPDKIAFLKRLRERNIFLGLTGTPTLEMFREFRCLYDATVIEAMQAGYLRNVVTEESAGKDYQVSAGSSEACKAAAVNYFGTTVYHRYTTKGYRGQKVWSDVEDFYKVTPDKAASVNQAIAANRQAMNVETNMIFSSDPVAQQSMRAYYQQLAGIGDVPDVSMIEAIRARRIELETKERGMLYDRLAESKTRQALELECPDTIVPVERYYAEVIQPEVMQGRRAHLARGVSATAMELMFFGCKSAKTAIAANNGAFDIFMHDIIQKHLVSGVLQPPEITDHYRRLLTELQDLDAYKAKIREKLNHQLPWENEAHKRRYIDLVCVEIDKMARLLVDPAAIQPVDLTLAAIGEEDVHVFDEYYVQVVNQTTQRSNPKGTKQALDGMDLGVTMHIIADKTLATGINKKPLLNVNICITDPHDELLEPALIAQAAGRCIRDDFKQGFCKMVVTEEVEAQFTAHNGQPFTPAKAFSKEFSAHYEQGLTVISAVKKAAEAFKQLLRHTSAEPKSPTKPKLK